MPLTIFVETVMLLASIHTGTCTSVGHKPGCWSAKATQLSGRADASTHAGREVQYTIPSPDRKLRVVAGDTSFAVFNGGTQLRDPAGRGLTHNSELAWADDSKAFFVTNDDGGAIGTFYVDVYQVKDGAMIWVDVSKSVIEDVKPRYRCLTPEVPNVAAITWIEGSSEILLAAQVPPHSSCAEMGKLFGYVVAVPSGEIRQRLSGPQLREDWAKYLGPGVF